MPHYSSCSKDNTLRYNHTLSAVQRFSLSAFNFHFNKSNEIFLHCQVKACQRWDLTSRCAKGCPFGKRKRRGPDSEYEVDQILAIGPIIVSLESKQALTRTGTVYLVYTGGPIRGYRDTGYLSGKYRDTGYLWGKLTGCLKKSLRDELM